MSNFPAWWAFCMLPENDGHADDTANDGAGATRWGWTYDTWCDAMAWTGQAASLDAFGTMTEAAAGTLAEAYFWNRYGGPQLASGCDVSVVDWAWNSGEAGAKEMQKGLGGLTIDGVIGPLTMAAIDRMGQQAFIANCYQWRVAFLEACGFSQSEWGGLYTRAADCQTLALTLTGES